METPQGYLNLASGFEDLWSPFPKEQIWGDILSCLHPRRGLEALMAKDFPEPQGGRRLQWQPSAVPHHKESLKKLTTGRSSFRPLMVLIWDLLPPSSSEPLLHLLLCESVFLNVGVKYTSLQFKLIPTSHAKASGFPSPYWKCVSFCILAGHLSLSCQCVSHLTHFGIKQAMNKSHKNSWYDLGLKVGNLRLVAHSEISFRAQTGTTSCTSHCPFLFPLHLVNDSFLLLALFC